MINESVKNNAGVAGLMGVGPGLQQLASQVSGAEEVLARTAKLEALRAAQFTGSLVKEGGAEFEARLKMVMDLVGERQAKLAEVVGGQDSNVNTDNNVNSDINVNTGNSVGAEAAGAEFISQITATIEGLNDQELANFFAELGAITSFFNTDSGKQKLAGMLAASEDRVSFANASIGAALERISDMLGLTSEADMFGEAFTVDFNAENIEHIVSIMWYLDQTINLINEKLGDSGFTGNAGNSAALTSAMELIDQDDPAALAGLSAALRKEKFNLEMAFRVVGVQEMISAMVAERSDKGAPSGIPQASNPANLGMSTSDTVKAFASLIKEELTSAMDRVRAITSGKVEMTEIEKAAVKLGAIKSEILSSAIDGNSAEKRAAFEKAAAELKAAMLKSSEAVAGADVTAENAKTENVKAGSVKSDGVNAGNVKSAAVNTIIKAASIDVTLPVSVSESVSKDAVKSVESANRKASESVSVAAKSASGDSVSLPLSAGEPANNETVEAKNNPPRPAMLAAQGFNVVLGGEVRFVSFSDEFRAEQAKQGNFWAAPRQPVSAAANNAEINTAVNADQNKAVINAAQINTAVNADQNKAVVNAAHINTAVNADQNKAAVNAAQINTAVNADQNKSVVNATHINTEVNADQNKAAVNTVQINAAVNADQNKAVVNAAQINTAVNADQNKAVVSAGQFADAPEIHANWTPGADKYGKYASGNPAAQSADAAANNAAANGANTQSSGIASANTSPDNMMAGTSGAGAEMPESSDSGEDATASFDTSNSKANAAVDQADKARAAAMARVDQEAIIRQLTDKMQLAIRNGAHELRVTLRPEALGEVRMSIRVHGDVVMARMQVENRQVKAIVESNLQSLKDSLEKQNLHVGAFSVDVGSDDGQSSRKTWREMAEEAGVPVSRGFKEGIGGGADGSDDNNDALYGEPGSDTGRRFGNNTFEYFI